MIINHSEVEKFKLGLIRNGEHTIYIFPTVRKVNPTSEDVSFHCEAWLLLTTRVCPTYIPFADCLLQKRSDSPEVIIF